MFEFIMYVTVLVLVSVLAGRVVSRLPKPRRIFDNNGKTRGWMMGRWDIKHRKITYCYAMSSPLFTLRWGTTPKGTTDSYGIGRGRILTWYGWGYWENKPRYLKDWTPEMLENEKI